MEQAGSGAFVARRGGGSDAGEVYAGVSGDYWADGAVGVRSPPQSTELIEMRHPVGLGMLPRWVLGMLGWGGIRDRLGLV